jgi:tRNA 2-thiouridine synthesizing protein E
MILRNMPTNYITNQDKKYRVDRKGFLIDPREWDEGFAESMAPYVKIKGELTKEHWKFIYFIRHTFDKMNVCPIVYVACKKNHIGVGDLKRLFPTGYLRGACKLAGVTYRESYMQHNWLEHNYKMFEYAYQSKVYRVDAQGFLADPAEWDEHFAINKAYELKMQDGLLPDHWKIIYYLRKKFKKAKKVPTIYELCEENDIELEKLEELFPDGYHRGAVKIAGLHVI